MWHRPELATWVELTLGAGIRHKLGGETAQLPLPVRLQSILPPRMHELVHSITPPIRFPLNQRIGFNRLERRPQIVHCPLLFAEEERPPRLGLIRRSRGL